MMMPHTIEEVKIRKEEVPALKPENIEVVKMTLYVRAQFPKQGSEKDAKYMQVGTNAFRINFWSEKQKQGDSMCQELHITRSLYVIVSKIENGGYCHKVFDK